MQLQQVFQPQTDASSGMSRAARARSEMLNLILSGRLPVGEPLQERQLAEMLEMSRTPIREALGRLEAESVVERRGKTLFVRQISIQEIKEVLAVREQLEGYAARQAAGRIAIVDIERLTKRINALANAKNIVADEHWDVDDALHNLIGSASGNAVLAQMISDLRVRTRMFDHDRVPDRFLPGCGEHLTILKAIAEGDDTAAEAAVQLHIRNARQGIFDRLFSN